MDTFSQKKGNIETRDLWGGGIHLLESGKTKLAQNFLYFVK